MTTMHYYQLFMGLVGLLGLGVVAILMGMINRQPATEPKSAKIAAAIRKGAMTFLREEYRIIVIVDLIVAAILAVVTTPLMACAFIAGSILSMSTGLIGMRAATAANVRTALAARDSGERSAFMMAFFGGGVMGFAVASFGLLGLGSLFYFFIDHADFLKIITAFGFGASLVAFFARVGGGIYTKSADVGADLVGKLEAGIPEDDPRNPAVIADNVGDCVGDTAGMGADIYESYIGAMVSSIVLAVSAHGLDLAYVTFPLMLSAIGLLSSIAGLVSNVFLHVEPAAMLRNALYIAMGAFLALTYGYMLFMSIDMALFVSIVIGCVAGILVGLITEYYTGHGPVRRIALSSETGAATNIIYGLSVGMESTVAPVITLAFGVLLAHKYGGGLLGVALAGVSMLSTVGISMTVDAYGPIADNAGGIAEMSGFDPKVRKITDKLDALGNTTAAMGKGFAIGSALLTALAFFAAYAQAAHMNVIDVLDPLVLTGLFIGAAAPFMVSALTMRSVSNAALSMVMEVRRQFRDIVGIMDGTGEPDYESCIAISTKAALREMMLPGIITVSLPVFIRFVLGKEALGGMLVGATVAGVLLALMMANGGGAWDNAKKYIEAGHLGGKGSDAHRAAVIGDTVGDPFKDTSGPALNILIKLMSVLSLLLVM
jgi:K(+)-stimulated pyrophosphate-energized sodium pump